MIDLTAAGWDDEWARAFEEAAAPGEFPGRVLSEIRGHLVVAWAEGELKARVPGRLYREAGRGGELPVVGDFVVLEPDRSKARTVLPRRTRLSRKAAGRSEEQVVAANVDVVFVAESAPEVNPRRLERFLAAAATSGAAPVVLFTKADLAETALDPGVPAHRVSAVSGAGIEAVLSHLGPGRTGVVIGPSGVGKSTLVNRLLGDERLAVGDMAASKKGRHTTTRRDLVALPDGSLVIDTPGVRELGLWEGGEGVRAAFEDVEALAASCRFADCRHEREPGCAVRAAVEEGRLDPERFESFRKLGREVARHAAERDALARTDSRRRDKVLTRALAERIRKKGRD